MTLYRFDGAPYQCVKFMQSIIGLVGNITGFEVYYHTEDIPDNYKGIPNVYYYEDEKRFTEVEYYLILHNDDQDITVLLGGGNCGYSGSGPSATKEILQICGVKMDYDRISNEKKIIENNVAIYHDLNFIIFEEKERRSLKHGLSRRRLKVSMKFQNGHDKWQAKKAFQTLGYINPLPCRNEDEENDFVLPYSTSEEWADYATNNTLTLSNAVKMLDNTTLENMIKEICYEHSADFNIRCYE
ncbi:hypothetical protein MHB59_23470 [Bacillus sp. FSL L8-0642]|uniref:hypothetical protein n=1 Tax=Bacillus sp. FSL L8-0642 TaxID=2921525 RepID=UPI0030F601A0|nr:hypothetical protein [Bacillus wiedmannii]